MNIGVQANKKKKVPKIANHGVIILLVLLMCVAKLFFSLSSEDESNNNTQNKSNTNTTSPQELPKLDLSEKLAQYEVKIGSQPENEAQKKLAEIFKNLDHKKPWNEVIDDIISKSVESILPKSSPPSDATVTLVTAVYDLGPNGDGLDMSDLRQIQGFLDYPQNKIIFLDESLVDLVVPGLFGNVKVVVLGLDKIKEYMKKPYEDIDRIHKNRDWKYQVGWLASSPQATIADFNILGMMKVFFLREASRVNPWKTRSFLWFDAAMNCGGRESLTQDKMTFFNQLFDRFLVPYFPYEVWTETHGFPVHSFNYFLGDNNKSQKVAKTWMIGGQSEFVEVTALVVDIILRETLREGQLGNGDCIYTILMSRFPRLVHPFNLVNSCGKSTQYDFSCDGYSNPAHWCSIIEWTLKGPPSGP